MKRMTYLCLAAGLMISVLACGCQSAGMISRGQSPAPFPQAAQEQEKIVQTSHQTPHEKTHAVSDAIHDYSHEMHNTSTTYSSEAQYAGCPSGNCPQGGYSHGSYCPPNGCRTGLCPTGRCGCGNNLNHYPTHHFSQSYHVPNDLSYPAQNSVGGAVVYPYYTHKGPSDFFRAK